MKRNERGGGRAPCKQREAPFAKGSSSYISSFVSQIDDLWDGWCSVVLCGIVLSWPTQRDRTLIISALCMEQGAGVVRMVKGVLEGGGPSDKAWWRWANDSRGRWREPSPMTTQPEPPPWSQRRTDTEREGGKERKGAKKERENKTRFGVCVGVSVCGCVSMLCVSIHAFMCLHSLRVKCSFKLLRFVLAV